ncbi:MAG: cardiolipin synthase [Verrucomicrobiales bacterium]|jgi:cardiolipin synthase
MALSVCAMILSSCTQHSGLRRTPSNIQPAQFGEVAAVEPSASSIPVFYDTGPKIRARMLDLIESATDYILINSFLVVTDPTTLEVMEALKKKHNSGVRIFVLADSSSIFMRPGKPGFKFLREAGIPFVEYNKLRLSKLIFTPAMFLRDHRKFWVVDGKTLFLGGANILASSLDPRDEGGNRDIMVEVESAAAIQQMIESFVDAWNRASSRKLLPTSFSVSANDSGPVKLWAYDQNRFAIGEDVILDMVENQFSFAQEEVWLIQPYHFVTAALLKKIRVLTERGVEVNLMLTDWIQAPRFHLASHYGIKNVLQAGGKVWLHRPENGRLHAKIIVVDDRCVSVGSANLNFRSLHLAKETNLVFDDAESLKNILPIVEDLKENCRPIELEEARRYRAPRYLGGWLLMQLGG